MGGGLSVNACAHSCCDGGLGGAEELLEEGSDTSRCGLAACVCGGEYARVCVSVCVCAFVFGRHR